MSDSTPKPSIVAQTAVIKGLAIVLHVLDDTVEGDKRQHFPCMLKWTCSCGNDCTLDFRQDMYLSYPSFGKESKAYLYCSKCEREDVIPVIPRLTLELVTP